MMDEEKTQGGKVGQKEMEGCTKGKMEVACGDGGRELEGMFGRNIATRVSKRLETSAICKNNLSNYKERLLASPSTPGYCTPNSLVRSLLLHICCTYVVAAVYCFG